MVELLKDIVATAKAKGYKIATMESCTGGGLANAITNISGSSEVFEFGAVTYSNDYKIKMGVSAEVIYKYTVYSKQTADEMSRAICAFTGADFGVGITGKLKRVDERNLCGADDLVYVSVFDKKRNLFYNKEIKVPFDTRAENKAFVIEQAGELLLKNM